MAEISKLSGVAIADVAAVDAVLKANIANILGLTLPSGAAFLLDTYTGAAAAYSTRRLASATTVLLRVRRETAGGTGDDDEADVAYDTNNELSLDSAISNASAGVTATTLGQFLNVGTVNGTTYTNPDSLTVTASCFVDEWKDQSGNSNHASQATQGSQPQIHSGTVDTDLITENGKPALVFYDDRRQLSVSFTSASQPNTAIVISTLNTAAVNNGQDSVGLDGSSNNTMLFSFQQNNYTPDEWQAYAGTLYKTNTASDDNQNIHFGLFNGASSTYHLNGTSIASGNFGSASVAGLTIGTNAQGIAPFDGTIQEVIFYPSDQSDNRTGIETDINGYFSIYT